MRHSRPSTKPLKVRMFEDNMVYVQEPEKGKRNQSIFLYRANLLLDELHHWFNSTITPVLPLKNCKRAVMLGKQTTRRTNGSTIKSDVLWIVTTTQSYVQLERFVHMQSRRSRVRNMTNAKLHHNKDIRRQKLFPILHPLTFAKDSSGNALRLWFPVSVTRLIPISTTQTGSALLDGRKMCLHAETYLLLLSQTKSRHQCGCWRSVLWCEKTSGERTFSDRNSQDHHNIAASGTTIILHVAFRCGWTALRLQQCLQSIPGFFTSHRTTNLSLISRVIMLQIHTQLSRRILQVFQLKGVAITDSPCFVE